MAKIIVNNPKQVINGGAKKYYFKVKGLGGLKGDKGDKGDKGEDGKMPTIAQITGQSTTEVMSQKATTDALNAKQATISSSNKLSADLVDDTNTTNKFVTSEDKANWNAKQNTLTAGENIDISNDVIRAKDTTYTAGNGLNLNGTEFSADTDVLATKSDLDSYYTKTETDTKLAPKLETEVVAELPTTGEDGKLYLTPKALTTQTATGNPITATVAEEAGKIESFQLDGDTFQQTYTGKNLARTLNGDYSYGEIQTYTLNDGEIITSRSDIIEQGGSLDITTGRIGQYASDTSGNNYLTSNGGAYTFSLSRNGEIEKATGKTARVGCYVYKMNSGGVKTNLGIVDLSEAESGSLVINLASDEYISAIVFYAQFCRFTDITFKAQLEEGSTATDFESYVAPSPNPEYPQPLQTVTGRQTVEIIGKNLFSKNDVEIGTILTDGSFSSTYNDARTSGYVPVLPNTTYVTSGRPNGLGIQSFYTKDKTFIQRTTTTSFTTPDNCYFVRLECHRLDVDIFQCELGSTATDYAPYSKQMLPIDLDTIELCKLGEYHDYIWKDGVDWKIHKAVGKAELWKGTNWRRLYTNKNSEFRFSVKVSNSDIPTSRESNEYIHLDSTHWMACTRIQTYYEIDGVSTTSRGDSNYESFIAYVDSLKTSDVDGWKAWLTANKPVVYYQSTTPTDTTITDQTLITQLEAIRTASLQNGANTITNTATGSNLAGDMEIGYYGCNPRNRYDKWLWLDIDNEYEQIGR